MTPEPSHLTRDLATAWDTRRAPPRTGGYRFEIEKIVKHEQRHLRLKIEDLRLIMSGNIRRLLKKTAGRFAQDA